MTIFNGDCLEVLRGLPDDSVESCVTDPPYGLSKEPNINEVLTKWLAGEAYDHGHGGFMAKSWDSFVPHPDVWREVYRVLKPGAYALVFAGTRTQDLMTIALRMAGFEVRDVIEWLYFSGFPKSMNISAIRDGWGTALKPAHEPIIVVRKPLIGTVADNVERYGTGGINIDGCRIAGSYKWRASDSTQKTEAFQGFSGSSGDGPNDAGRFPANAITTDDDAFYSPYFNVSPAEVSKKASKKDRNADWTGAEISLEPKFTRTMGDGIGARPHNEAQPTAYNRNSHPTVKPTDLMAWLVRLVTPPGGTVLDPFAGSGTTLVAAKREGFEFIGIEREAEYVDIIAARTGESA